MQPIRTEIGTAKKMNNSERTAMCCSSPPPDSMLVDSGTTSQMTALSSRVSGQRNCDTTIHLADDSTVSARKIGVRQGDVAGEVGVDNREPVRYPCCPQHQNDPFVRTGIGEQEHRCPVRAWKGFVYGHAQEKHRSRLCNSKTGRFVLHIRQSKFD